MIKVSKYMSSKKSVKRQESFSPNMDKFLTFLIIFEWGRIF